MEEKYRKNVAVVVFSSDKKVLICDRKDYKSHAWQFPQGGVDKGETIEEAAYRELWEETSIKSAKLIKILDEPIIYTFPEKVREKLRKDNIYNLGQAQHWVLFYFYGNDDEINLDTINPEFKGYIWEEPEFAINNVVDFKKQSYEKALALLHPYIKNYID